MENQFHFTIKHTKNKFKVHIICNYDYCCWQEYSLQVGSAKIDNISENNDKKLYLWTYDNSYQPTKLQSSKQRNLISIASGA